MNRIAIVTGASRGIGAAIVRNLVEDGLYVLCVSHSGSFPKNVARVHIESYALDVSDADKVAAFGKKVGEKYERIEVLVNNAGIIERSDKTELTNERWKRVLSTNLDSAFYMTQAIVPFMKGFGSIVNMSSISGLNGFAHHADYAASKAGLIGLTKSTSKEEGPNGIICNAVCPGPVETDMMADLPKEYRERILSKVALKRFATPKEIAHLVSFLCSPKASYITGQAYVIDGGLSL